MVTINKNNNIIIIIISNNSFGKGPICSCCCCTISMAMALDVSGTVRAAAVSSSASSSSSSPSSSSASFSPFARCRGDPLAAGAKSRRSPSVSSVLPSCCGLKVCAPATPVLPVSSRTSPRSSSSSASKVLCQKQPAAPTSAGPPANATSEAAAVDDKTWKSLVLDSDIPVLVDFWAPWCGPCRMIAPLIDDLARQYAGRLRCLKLNTDESPNTATEYGIRSIPTVMIFKGGQKKDTVIGAVPKATLISTIEKYLEW